MKRQPQWLPSFCENYPFNLSQDTPWIKNSDFPIDSFLQNILKSNHVEVYNIVW
jgi:hypothetical protein